MENIKYIVNSKGEKISVVLERSSYEYLWEFLKYRLILSVLDLSLEEHLELSGEKSDETLFLKSLLAFADYRNDFSNGRWKYKVTVLDRDIAKIQSCSDKTVANRRDQLLAHMEFKRKAIIDFVRDSENKKIGSEYRLNFIEAIKNSVEQFLEKESIETNKIIEIIDFVESNRFSNLGKSNKNYKILSELLKKNLNNLSRKPTIIESPAVKGTRKNLKERYSNKK